MGQGAWVSSSPNSPQHPQRARGWRPLPLLDHQPGLPKPMPRRVGQDLQGSPHLGLKCFQVFHLDPKIYERGRRGVPSRAYVCLPPSVSLGRVTCAGPLYPFSWSRVLPSQDMFAVAVSLVTGKVLYISDQVASIFHCKRDAFLNAKLVEFLAPGDVSVFHSSTTPDKLPPWSHRSGPGEGPQPHGRGGAGRAAPGVGSRSPLHLCLRRAPPTLPIPDKRSTAVGQSKLRKKSLHILQRENHFRNVRPFRSKAALRSWRPAGSVQREGEAEALGGRWAPARCRLLQAV